ncbi:MAG TPA: hypothetical protein VFK68_02390, partial [Propionibacteriaceae bacterium]|nr:hypothetical protein [Propionibacteriaceae bacterium]
HPADGVWTRLTQIEPGRLVLHLINLTGQPDLEWDAPKTCPGATGPGRLRVRRTGPRIPRVRVADPDGTGVLAHVDGTLDGEHAVFTLPEPGTWQLVTIDL